MHRDVAPDVYYQRELGLASKSALDFVGVSPRTYRAWIDGEFEEPASEALTLGNAFDCLALEPERFPERYAVQPDFGDCRGKEPKARRDAWRKEHEGKTWLTLEDESRLLGMLDALYSHSLASKLLRGGKAQCTIRWDDEALGLPCKGRLDYLLPDVRVAIDLKTALDASEHAFSRAVEKYRYHAQQAMYEDGLAAIGMPVEHFVFVAVEKAPPYLIGVYALNAKDVQLGRERNRVLLETLATCLHRDEWPGLPSNVVEVRLPRWAR